MDLKGSEPAAVQILTRAVQLDGEKKFSEAVTCYEQGIRLLMLSMKETVNEEKKQHFRKKISEYLDRAEIMKKAALKEKEMTRNHKQIHINDNDTGYSYERVFSSLIDEDLSSVEVEDAYIRSTHQVYNFLHFCELLVRKASNLNKIFLHTTYCTENRSLQNERLKEIYISLSNYKISLEVRFSDTLHDREIRFDNGWIVKIGRGLDYFKRASGRFSVGFSDYDLRTCHETTIDIFHKSTLKPS